MVYGSEVATGYSTAVPGCATLPTLAGISLALLFTSLANIALVMHAHLTNKDIQLTALGYPRRMCRMLYPSSSLECGEEAWWDNRPHATWPLQVHPKIHAKGASPKHRIARGTESCRNMSSLEMNNPPTLNPRDGRNNVAVGTAEYNTSARRTIDDSLGPRLRDICQRRLAKWISPLSD